MKYTFEITVAGCAMNCAHCYVDGGIGSAMRFDDFSLLIQRLKPILDRLNGEISVTLGNELFCNPDIVKILGCCAENLPRYFSYKNFPVPTTSLALFGRKDRDEILSLLRLLGAEKFMLALHGRKDRHNAIVQNPGAFGGVFRTARYLSENGFGILLNLIVSKALADDFPQTASVLSALPYDVRLTVPLYVPTERMRRYQSLRANRSEAARIADQAERNGFSSDSLRKHCEVHSENAVLRELSENGFDYDREKNAAADWVFFHITQRLDLYYGNVGAHTKYLGNLKTAGEEALYRTIAALGANYDYNAFFDDSVFYGLDHILRKLPARSENLVYPSKADCIYAWLDELHQRSRLI